MSELHGYQRFFAELKRRRVFRVAAVYGATAFVVVQAADVLQEALLLPGAFLTGVAVLALLGFPIAIVLAWAYERTAEGVVRTEEATTEELADIVAQPAARRWPSGLLALVGIVALAAAAWLTLVRGPSADGDIAAPVADATVDAAEAPDQAVAVLPFADLAGTDESRAFALGLHDDLMTQLTQVPDLKVTSRTSVMAYEGETRPVAEIARELGVGSIVEGGVRTSGGRVRLNIQLIDPATDDHLWARTFDEELTAENVFEIQGEIARAVATALEAELSQEADAALGTVLTENIEAWNAYHEGKLLQERSNEPESERATVAAFERAVELDPEFVAAWAGLVRNQAWLIRRGLESDTMPARRSLDAIQALDPNGADALYAEAVYQYYARADFESALAAIQAARRARPGDPEILQNEGWVLRRLGRWDEAMVVIDRAIQLDPRNSTLLWNQALNNYRLRRFGAGSRQLSMALELDPGGPIVGAFFTELKLFSEGDSATARLLVEAGRGLDAEGQGEALEYWLAYMARDYDRAIELARGLTGEPTVVLTSSTVRRTHSRAMRLALAYRMAGDGEAARLWADTAVAEARAALAERPEPVPWDRFGAAASAHAYLGTSLALRGEPGDAEEAVRHAEEAVRLYGYDRDSQDSDTFDWLLVRTYVLTDRTDEALAFMDELLSRPSVFGLGDLKLDPLYDELREDPRWEDLIQQAEAQIEW